SYRYERPVSLGPQSVRLRPAPHCRTRILSYSLKVTPKIHFINWQQDPQSNYIARLVFPERTTELSIEVDLVADSAAQTLFDFCLEPHAEKSPFEYDPSLREELAPYRRMLPGSPLFDAFVAKHVLVEPKATNAFLVDLNRHLSEAIEYRIRM